MSEQFHLHTDETSHVGGHRYMAIGSVLTHSTSTQRIDRALENSLPLGSHLRNGELKWKKVRPMELDAYKSFVGCLFDEIERGRAWFHLMVLKTWQFNHARFNQGDAEVGFYKFMYHHYLKFSRCIPDAEFHAYPDSKQTLYDLDELRTILNRGARHHGAGDPFRLIEFRDSANARLIQVADIVAGSIAYTLNGRHKIEGAAPAKRDLASFIESRKPLVPALHWNSHPSKKAFNIWHFQLR